VAGETEVITMVLLGKIRGMRLRDGKSISEISMQALDHVEDQPEECLHS
jgi:hypothetical protein